ncbi:hypothetical protein [Fibrella forsythiae]|uniref:hypothetical protein n=1 Tax=Fibrella forsythiae TaxID=2817061 RepID=UPI001E4E02FE|nr:hypothetical protein [Fibrella forsythiae]
MAATDVAVCFLGGRGVSDVELAKELADSSVAAKRKANDLIIVGWFWGKEKTYKVLKNLIGLEK